MIPLRLEMQDLMELAKRNLLKDGEVCAIAFIHGPEITLMPLNHLHPDIRPALLQVIVQKMKATRVLHVDEAWVAHYDPHQSQKIRPRDREDRMECIIIQGKDKGGELEVLQQIFDRDVDGKPVFKQPAEWFEKANTSRMLDHVFEEEG